MLAARSIAEQFEEARSGFGNTEFVEGVSLWPFEPASHCSVRCQYNRRRSHREPFGAVGQGITQLIAHSVVADAVPFKAASLR